MRGFRSPSGRATLCWLPRVRARALDLSERRAQVRCRKHVFVRFSLRRVQMGDHHHPPTLRQLCRTGISPLNPAPAPRCIYSGAKTPLCACLRSVNARLKHVSPRLFLPEEWAIAVPDRPHRRGGIRARSARRLRTDEQQSSPHLGFVLISEVSRIIQSPRQRQEVQKIGEARTRKRAGSPASGSARGLVAEQSEARGIVSIKSHDWSVCALSCRQLLPSTSQFSLGFASQTHAAWE